MRPYSIEFTYHVKRAKVENTIEKRFKTRTGFLKFYEELLRKDKYDLVRVEDISTAAMEDMCDRIQELTSKYGGHDEVSCEGFRREQPEESGIQH